MTLSTELIVRGDDPGEDAGFAITAVTRLKHTDLYEAAKSLGSVRALAEHLGVSYPAVSQWINMIRCPPLSESLPHWPQSRIDKLEQDLLELTGKLLPDLFPDELLQNVDYFRENRIIEKKLSADKQAMLAYATHTTARLKNIANDSPGIDADDLGKVFSKLLKTLTFREREILKMRYGLEGHTPLTLTKTGVVMKITRERVRQIEMKAIRKLMAETRSEALLPFVRNTSGQCQSCKVYVNNLEAHRCEKDANATDT